MSSCFPNGMQILKWLLQGILILNVSKTILTKLSPNSATRMAAERQHQAWWHQSGGILKEFVFLSFVYFTLIPKGSNFPPLKKLRAGNIRHRGCVQPVKSLQLWIWVWTAIAFEGICTNILPCWRPTSPRQSPPRPTLTGLRTKGMLGLRPTHISCLGWDEGCSGRNYSS